MAVGAEPSIFAQMLAWLGDLGPLFKFIGTVVAVIGAVIGLVRLRPGTVKMTQPTIFSFGTDGPDEAYSMPKISFRAALYSTAPRSWIIERMYVELVRTVEPTHETKPALERFRFDLWRCDGSDAAGLTVGPQGQALNHEFLLPRAAGGATFVFFEGRYTVRVFATLAGWMRKTVQLGTFTLDMSRDDFFALGDHGHRLDKPLDAVPEL